MRRSLEYGTYGTSHSGMPVGAENFYLSIGESEADLSLAKIRASPNATLGQVLNRLGYNANSAESEGYLLLDDTPLGELIPLGHVVAGRTERLPMPITAKKQTRASSNGVYHSASRSSQWTLA